MMRMGTKSLLFGIHQFVLHPIFVCWAWIKLYGFPLDPRIWIAIIIHDWGYWGKRRMDDEEGERHVEFASRCMRIFDRSNNRNWSQLCLFHSRSYSDRYSSSPSMLCYADKLAIALYPDWLYLALGRASGEIWEYMQEGKTGKYKNRSGQSSDDPKEWLHAVKDYSVAWVAKETGGFYDGRKTHAANS